MGDLSIGKERKNRNMKKGNSVAAVVVTYNRKALLEKCISCLLAQEWACDIMVVDNASSDGTEEMVAQIADNCVRYRSTGANLGGAGGFNSGMRWAVEAGYDYVWVMDDDCLPKSNALSKLMEADNILEGNYGFLSSVVLWTDGKECKMNRQKIKKSYYEHAELLRRGIIQVEQATFVSLLFPSKIIRQAGLPIKEFFIWGDDIEYTRRLAVRMGLPCYMAGQSQVIHAMKDNNGSSIATDNPERIDRYKYAFRNEAYLYRKEGFKGMGYYWAKCGLNCYRVFRHAQDHRLKRLRVLLSSMVKGLFFFPKVELLQRESEKLRIEIE